MPLFYHGAAAVVKMDYCCFCHSVRCIILHGEKVQKWCDLLSPSLSFIHSLLLGVCLPSLPPSFVASLVFAGGGMASAGRGEIPPKSDPPLCVWFLLDFFLASNASRRLLTSCGVAAPCPLTVFARNLPQVGRPNFTPCGNCQIAHFSQLFDGLRRVAPGRGTVMLDTCCGVRTMDYRR